MSNELLATIFGGLTGLLGILGLPKYIEYKREKQNDKIKELTLELEVARSKADKYKQEAILEREKRRTSESHYHRMIDRINTNLVYLEMMSESDPDLKKIFEAINSTMNITPAQT